MSGKSIIGGVEHVTVVGFGSLLSVKSSRTTFPELKNFRLARIRGWRRVFAHPASIFFKRGIWNMDTREICSLSAEPMPMSNEGEGKGENSEDKGFLVSAFEMPAADMNAFIEREEEFNIWRVEISNLKTCDEYE